MNPDVMLVSFLSGATFMACVAVALQFLRLWRRTGERLFGFFLAAFVALGPGADRAGCRAGAE